MSSVYAEDSGEYSCRASNDYGEAVTSCKMTCTGRRTLILDSQLGTGAATMDKIAELEGLGGPRPTYEKPEEDSGQSPTLTQLQDLDLAENSVAHFEAKVSPVDSHTKIEWFHNGRAVSHSNRIKMINDFGFCILEITGVSSRDSGVYVCKVMNYKI